MGFSQKGKPSLNPRRSSKDFAKNISFIGAGGASATVGICGKVEQLEEHQTSFIQAQTGLGKAYGYLLPALNLERSSRDLVSVPTKILQNQIMQEEGQRLKEVFHLKFIVSRALKIA